MAGQLLSSRHRGLPTPALPQSRLALASKTTVPGTSASMVMARLMQSAEPRHMSLISSYVPAATKILSTALSPTAATSWLTVLTETWVSCRPRCTGRGAAEHLCACTDAVRVMGRRSRGHRGRVDVAQPRTHKHSRTSTHAQALTRTRTRKRIRKHMQTCTHTRARANPHTHTNRHRRARARTHPAVDSRWCLVTPALLPTSQLKRRSPQLSCRKGGNKSERFWARAGKE